MIRRAAIIVNSKTIPGGLDIYYMSSEQFYPLGCIFRRKIGYIWVVFGKQRLIIRNAIASLAVRNGSQI